MEFFASAMLNVMAAEGSLGLLFLSVLGASPAHMVFDLSLYRQVLPCVWQGVWIKMRRVRLKSGLNPWNGGAGGISPH
jgi:hypothetical protein